jgi:HAD superfamily hydrolase (TIGR01450 family)
MIQTVTVHDLIQRHDALYFDAFGVLINAHGAIPGAVALVAHLRAIQKPFWVLTNDASRRRESAARRYQHLGLHIETQQIITSGSLLTAHFNRHHLRGARCWVLGTDDSRQEALDAGAELLDYREDLPDDAIDALIVCDDEGYPFLATVEAALSLIVRRIDAGRPLHLILPNPDIIYPKRSGHFGFTSGGVALLIEHALLVRYPNPSPHTQFIRLGKPYAPIFDAAATLSQAQNPVMIGDQVPTDILGAHQAGIASALVATGLSTAAPPQAATHTPPSTHAQPTYFLPSLHP